MFLFSHLEINKAKNNGILHSLICYFIRIPMIDILKILENHRILVVSIIFGFNLFIYLLSFFYSLFFFRNFFFQHILKFNHNLFIKSIMITGIFEKYSNKNKINFNRKNLRLQNNFRLKKISFE